MTKPFVLVVGEPEVKDALAGCPDLEVWPTTYQTYEQFFADSNAGIVPDSVPNTVVVVSDAVPETGARFAPFVTALAEHAVALCWTPLGRASAEPVVPLVTLPVTLNGLRQAITARCGEMLVSVDGGDLPIFIPGHQEAPSATPAAGGLRDALRRLGAPESGSIATMTPPSPVAQPPVAQPPVAQPPVAAQPFPAVSVPLAVDPYPPTPGPAVNGSHPTDDLPSWASGGPADSVGSISAASAALRDMLGDAYDTGESPIVAPARFTDTAVSPDEPLPEPPPAFSDPGAWPAQPAPANASGPSGIFPGHLPSAPHPYSTPDGEPAPSGFGSADLSSWSGADATESWPPAPAAGPLPVAPPPDPSALLAPPLGAPLSIPTASFFTPAPEPQPMGVPAFAPQPRPSGVGTPGRGGPAHLIQCYTLCVWSSKGGVGKTTVAMNLAARLAMADVPTCVVDLDITSGDVNFRAFGTEAAKHRLPITIIDILSQRTLEREWLSDNLPREPSTGFYLVNAPRSSQSATDQHLLSPAIYDRLLKVLTQMFEVVILDCPDGLESNLVTGFALPRADGVCVVIDNDRSALMNLRQSLITVTSTPGIGVAKQRIGLFLNQQVAFKDPKARISRSDIEKFLTGYPIVAEVSMRPEDQRTAANRSELLVAKGDPELTMAVDQALQSFIERLNVPWDAMPQPMGSSRGGRVGGPSVPGPAGGGFRQWFVENSSLFSKLMKPR